MPPSRRRDGIELEKGREGKWGDGGGHFFGWSKGKHLESLFQLEVIFVENNRKICSMPMHVICL